MGFLSGLVWNQLTELPHPVLNKAQCVNRYRRNHCTACADICPEQVIGENLEVKSWSRCIDCGRCASVCQTRAITPSQQQMGQLLALRSAEGDTLWLGCSASARENDLRRSCLCDLSWESLAYLSFHRHLVLDLEPCKVCENPQCKELLRENLQRLHQFLGEEGFEGAVTLAHSAKTAPKPEKELSRRGLFLQAGAVSKTGAGALLKHSPLLGTEDLELEGISFRKLLHKPMKESSCTFRWEIPALKDGCTGCGLCVERCPTKALKVEEEKAMLVLESWRCVQCRSCVIACPQKRIGGIETVRIRDFSPLCLTHIERIVCRVCGAALQKKTQNGLCAECTRKRMQEAAQRRRREEESV